MNCNVLFPIPHTPEMLNVSIPNRDFDELQFADELFTKDGKKFQSLIGILMNCNSRYFKWLA